MAASEWKREMHYTECGLERNRFRVVPGRTERPASRDAKLLESC